MNLDHPSTHHIPQLRLLWQEAFGDSDEALDAFFQTAFDPARCLCAWEGAELAAAAYWFSCGEYAYIYAVATAKAHRGKGLCHALMNSIHHLLTAQGYEGAMVVPGEESLRQFYAGMGYENFGGIREFSCQAGLEAATLTEIDTETFAALRRQYLPQGGVIQEGENLAYLARFVRFYAGKDFLLTATETEEGLFGMELLGNAEAAPGILTALGQKTGIFRTQGEVPWGMHKPLGDKNSPTYLGFAFD